jgi:predicted MPP superfamily phosphohydrolase
LPFTEGLIGPAREWFPKHTGGIYADGGTKMVVSRGIGNHTGVPRFLNNPEVSVVILRQP